MKTIFTNGCFDILHRGHFELLKYARDLGDRLIVAINTDSSVKRLKGENRPFFNQAILRLFSDKQIMRLRKNFKL